MARKKTTPIDGRNLKSLNDPTNSSQQDGDVLKMDIKEKRIVRTCDETPLLSFGKDGKIDGMGTFHKHHEPNDCFEFKPTWTSESWKMGCAGRGNTGSKKGKERMQEEDDDDDGDQTVGTLEERNIAMERHENRMKRYNSTNVYRRRYANALDRTDVAPPSNARKPKQRDLPPLDPFILQLAAKQLETEKETGEKADGVSLAVYWHNARVEASEQAELDRLTMPKPVPKIWDNESEIKEWDDVDMEDDDRSEYSGSTTPRAHVVQPSIENTSAQSGSGDSEGSSEEGISVKQEPSSSQGSSSAASEASEASEASTEYELPVVPSPSARLWIEAPPIVPVIREAHRACTNCYDLHNRCDRALPECMECAVMGYDCVYLDGPARTPKNKKKSENSKRRPWEEEEDD